jgi:hypothetical protein
VGWRRSAASPPNEPYLYTIARLPGLRSADAPLPRQVLYIFHANTDGLDMLQQSAGAALKQGATFRAKVRRVHLFSDARVDSHSTRAPTPTIPCGWSSEH